jgi:hypothetical protein
VRGRADARPTLGVVAGVVLGLVGPAPAARADSCLMANFEKVQLQLVDAHVGGQPTAAPAQLAGIGEMYVSDVAPAQVYFPDASPDQHLWQFELAEPVSMAPAVERYLSSLPLGELSACTGKPVPYAPLRSGRYAPVMQVTREVPAVTDASLRVDAGRDQVSLEATLGGRRYEVRWRITCAAFVGSDGGCAPSVATANAQAEARADTDAGSAAAPGSGTAGPLAPALRPVGRKPGCRGCGAAGGRDVLGGATLVLLVGPLRAARRRRRARCRRS